MKRTMLQKFGILGLISLLSYTTAVVFAPLAYPGYNWLAQAVSDFSADSASSRTLWNQLAALYMPCGIVCCTMCGLEVSANPNRALRTGVYIFYVMNWLSAASVSLTRTEYAILKLLMQNPEQIISREVMLERISEDTPDCTEGSLKTHVSHLRGKLRRVGGRDFIETVRGAGFRLVS